MEKYRFDMIGANGETLQSRFFACVDDLDALDLAETLCARNAVDVWDGSRRVLHVKLKNAMATPADDLPG